MKKNLLVILTICFAGFLFIVGCRNSTVTPQPTIQQQITGKWTMKSAIGNYTVLGTTTKDTIRFTAADYFNFKADGTLTIVETGSTYNGKWSITNNKLFITDTHYIDYASGFDIPVITASSLQLYYTETNSTNILEQKLDFVK